MRPSILPLALLLGISHSPVFAAEETVLQVFASVLPVQTFVDEVGDGRVETRVMVVPGQSPATYDPSPKQVAALADAELYVRVGVPFEDAWMKRIRAANPAMAVLDLRDGLDLRPQTAHDHGADDAHGHHHHEHEAMDPHIWTSPPNVRTMLVSIRDQLTALDPDGSSVYERNRQRYDAELQRLDTWLEETLSDLDHRAFLVYHPAWGYFADTYGLEQVPIERAGKEPGPRRLSALIEQAKAVGARAIFVQPEFDQRIAEQIARSIDGRVEVATPLAVDYVANLKRFARILVDANQAPETAKTTAPDGH
ncbi:metal ABC transporter solute-binding protein, Zn/Mn family [Halochromatium glycolicum]|uniref:metal ABC transporter solute-binding protein, Zn/Mn family n=1 Tax=Halochromatium glycolicum TaxID=85075 RepID=UPI0030B821DD